MVRTVQRVVLILIAAIVVAVGSGCRAQRAGWSRETRFSEAYCAAAARAMFGPVVVDRADWPSARDGRVGARDVTYRTTLIDHQGRFGARDDYLQRRFISSQAGRVHR